MLMTRKAVKVQQQSAKEAKAEVSLYENRVQNAEVRLGFLATEEQGIRDRIAQAKIEQEQAVSDWDVERAKTTKLFTDNQKLEEERTKKEKELETTYRDIKKAKKALDSIEAQVQLKNIKATREALDLLSYIRGQRDLVQQEFEVLELKVTERKSDLVDLQVRTSKAEAVLMKVTAEVKAGKEAKAVIVNDVDGLKKEILKLQEEVGTLKGKKDEVASLEKELLQLKKDQSEWVKKIEARKVEYEAFDEKTTKRMSALKKLEEGIDAKTRRLKAIKDEKGIETYLISNDV